MAWLGLSYSAYTAHGNVLERAFRNGGLYISDFSKSHKMKNTTFRIR